MRPTPSPTGSTGSRSMSPAIGEYDVLVVQVAYVIGGNNGVEYFIIYITVHVRGTLLQRVRARWSYGVAMVQNDKSARKRSRVPRLVVSFSRETGPLVVDDDECSTELSASAVSRRCTRFSMHQGERKWVTWYSFELPIMQEICNTTIRRSRLDGWMCARSDRRTELSNEDTSGRQIVE